MSVYEQEIYLKLEQALEQSQKNQSNLLVVSFSGNGTSYILKSYVKKHPEVGYIDKRGMNLGKLTIIDSSMEIAVKYWKQLGLDQKLVIVVSRGSDYRSEMATEIRRHSYLSIGISARNRNDTDKLALEINPDLQKDELEEIWRLSGGIGKLIKYLAINRDQQNEELEMILAEIRSSLRGYNLEDLEKLGIMEQGKVRSELLVGMMKGETNIKINFDLSAEEDGQRMEEKLTETEARILERMIDEEGRISKEEISDIKWGEGKYDQFSDQAINKAMRRLDRKLKKYKITTIPKVGFVIDKR